MEPISNTIKTLVVRTRKTLWALGLNAFWLILFFVILDVILGGLIFYKYVFLAEREEFKVEESIVKFNEEVYQKVLVELQAKDQSSGELPVE